MLSNRFKNLRNSKSVLQKPSKLGRWIIKPFLERFQKLLRPRANHHRSYQNIFQKHTASSSLSDQVQYANISDLAMLLTMILPPRSTKAPLLHQMTNLLLLILPLDPREFSVASKVSVASMLSGVSLQTAQLLPYVEARGVLFIPNYAYKDWLKEDRLTTSAQTY